MQIKADTWRTLQVPALPGFRSVFTILMSFRSILETTQWTGTNRAYNYFQQKFGRATPRHLERNGVEV